MRRSALTRRNEVRAAEERHGLAGTILRFLSRRRWEPPMRRNRRGELVHPQVSPPYRVISGFLAVFMLGVAGLAARSGFDWVLLLSAGSLGVAGGWIALFGWNQVVIEPEASERFRALADPSRPLPADDDPPGPEPSSRGEQR